MRNLKIVYVHIARYFLFLLHGINRRALSAVVGA
jgi:hypothetical protein